MGKISDLVDEFLDPTLGRSGKLVAAAKMVAHVLMWPAIDDITMTESIAVNDCMDYLAMIDPIVGRELKLYWMRRGRILHAAVLGHEYHSHVMTRVKEIAQMAIEMNPGIIPEWKEEDTLLTDK
ncbi:MAG: hypothetical protein JSW61_13365 [Candidatus Thorarchaeota archaeon]|nr:MAG: hypothetical protein JSW61_13365 [Candidatus Thorarchaeota archaeon]